MPLFESSDKQDILVMNDSSNGGNIELHIKPSWPILINLLQTRYIDLYSTQFCLIPKFNTDDIPSTLVWSSFEIMSICKYFWQILIQNKIVLDGLDGKDIF